MPHDKLALIEKRLPRYTSYPAAPHFSEEVGPAQYRRWLASVEPGTPVSLYLHIPFCNELCWFCGCNTQVVRRTEVIARYAERLRDEIALVANALPANLPVGQVHFGGGSPNSLSAESLGRIMTALETRFWFSPETEVAVELDPRTTGPSFIDACAGAGITRASLGVQDLDPAVQRAINRIQPYELIADTMARLRATGLRDINVDLMYGLPHQTVDGILATVEKIAGLRPARIALFGYAHVPWMKKHQALIDEAALPGPEERLRQAKAAAKALVDAGYEPVGMDHFARPDSPLGRARADGDLRRNFQGYTTDRADVLLGFGASAIGMLPDGYVQNSPDVRDWERTVATGALPIARGIAIDGEDRLRRAVIERIMCDMAVDLDAVTRSCGTQDKNWAAELAALRPLADDGLIDIDGSVLRLRPDNRHLVRVVAAAFDSYLESGKPDDAAEAPKHAPAV